MDLHNGELHSRGFIGGIPWIHGMESYGVHEVQFHGFMSYYMEFVTYSKDFCIDISPRLVAEGLSGTL